MVMVVTRSIYSLSPKQAYCEATEALSQMHQETLSTPVVCLAIASIAS